MGTVCDHCMGRNTYVCTVYDYHICNKNEETEDGGTYSEET